ncbi:3-oxoacyl-ACP synthase [Pareuzebyella sediminis]|uniref:3-oxoacyl-ACP synthase n=1 Tax=Pareuzebyella sediminis TaxID=2607998 RepID=UPI0011EF0442|nr:3-oxoacyl-ACP synthase [Pareuzebyella sediminis]
MKGIEIKRALYEFCKSFADLRIDRIRNNLGTIQEALASETKSSAGDKHETGRAMLHLEYEKLGQQLDEAEKMRMVLYRINIGIRKEKAGLGSWVKTSKGDYFLAISAGPYTFRQTSVYCISVNAPIGQLVLGKSAGDTINHRGQEIKILQIE